MAHTGWILHVASSKYSRWEGSVGKKGEEIISQLHPSLNPHERKMSGVREIHLAPL